MKKYGSKFLSFGWLLILGLSLVACSAPPQVIPPTPVIVQQTVVVVITATPPPDSPTLTLEPTAAAVPTATDQPTVISVPPSSTPAPVIKPSPTALQLLNIPIEGGDSNHMFFARLVFPDYKPAATTSLVFQVYAHSPMNAAKDGEGITSVEFTIFDPDGNQVYDRIEKTAGYCAFGGGEPTCTVFDFAQNKYQWPNGGAKIVSGLYTIKVQAVSKDNVDMFGQTYIRIQVP